MDESAMFKISYGLFMAGVEYNEKLSGCIINTATQVTVTPNKMAVTMQKDNYTTEQIKLKGSMTITVLSLSVDLKTIERFGYKSSRDVDKYDGIEYKIDDNKNPYLSNELTAYMSLQVKETIDLGTHYQFICNVVNCENISNEEAITYADYRKLKAGISLNKGETPKEEPEKKYICSVCHYIYDGDIPFEDLPDDYVCPICKKGKEAFVLL